MTPEQDQPNATASDSLQQAEYVVMTDEERVARALRDKAQHVEQVRFCCWITLQPHRKGRTSLVGRWKDADRAWPDGPEKGSAPMTPEQASKLRKDTFDARFTVSGFSVDGKTAFTTNECVIPVSAVVSILPNP